MLNVVLGSGFTDQDQECSQEMEESVLGAETYCLDKKMPGGKYRAKIFLRKCLTTPLARIGSKICFSFYRGS